MLVDDDEIIADTLERCLVRENFSVQVANSGTQALFLVKKQMPSLVLLDVMMPDMDGYEVCQAMRNDKKLANVPVIFLTAKTSEVDHIIGFKAGGDDYVNKPFTAEELILRVKALLKRTQQNHKKANRTGKEEPRLYESKFIGHSKITQPIIELRGYRLNILTFELTLPNDKKILLTPIQFDLLFNFMSHPNDIFPPSALLSIIWDYPPDTGTSDLVRVHIKNLRMRIEDDPSNPTFLETVPGYGYTVKSSSIK